MKVINEVCETKDYEKFIVLESNRVLTTNANLEKSIKEVGIIVPVIVNELYEVIDGQHRINLAKKLNIPVPFVKVDGLSKKEMIQINTSGKVWTVSDYVKSYASEGRENYMKLVELEERRITSMNMLVKLASNIVGSSRPINRLKQGEFEFYNEDFLNLFLDDYEVLKKSLGANVPGNLIIAVYAMNKLKEFKMERLINNAGLLASKIRGVNAQTVLSAIALEVYHLNLPSNSKQALSWRTGSKGEVIFLGELKDVFNKSEGG